MTLCVIDNESYNLSLDVSLSMKDKTVEYKIVGWDKVHHKIETYVYKDGEFETACDKFGLMEVSYLPLRGRDFIADLQLEQREQM